MAWDDLAGQLNMTPRERRVDGRLAGLEAALAQVCQDFYDGGNKPANIDGNFFNPAATITTNTTNAVLDLKDQRIMELERANLQLREEIQGKDKEIARLTDLCHIQDSRLDEYHDTFIAVRTAMDDMGEGW